MRISERNYALSNTRLHFENTRAVASEARAPEIEAPRRDRKPNLSAQPVSIAMRSELRPREKSQIGSGVAFGVGVEQMVGAGIILVDALFDETHPEDAGVEIEILLRGTSDGSDVMKTGDFFHAGPFGI